MSDFAEQRKQLADATKLGDKAFEGQRRQLVESMGLKGTLKKAFLAVPREKFFPKEIRQYSYDDSAFPIGFGQTISQPSTIAQMLEMLKVEEGHRILEVGSGSGYVLALLGELAGKGKVFAVELVHELQQKAVKALALLGCKNVETKTGDGSLGWKEKAPFDRILVSAACASVPSPLVGQLKEKGIIVAPVGGRFSQELVALRKEKGKAVEKERRCCFVFVPLKGTGF